MCRPRCCRSHLEEDNESRASPHLHWLQQSKTRMEIPDNESTWCRADPTILPANLVWLRHALQSGEPLTTHNLQKFTITIVLILDVELGCPDVQWCSGCGHQDAAMTWRDLQRLLPRHPSSVRSADTSQESPR